MSRLDDALRWLAGEISATRDEFLRAQYPGGDMLLTGLTTGDYIQHGAERFAVSPVGFRRLEAIRGQAEG